MSLLLLVMQQQSGQTLRDKDSFLFLLGDRREETSARNCAISYRPYGNEAMQDIASVVMSRAKRLNAIPVSFVIVLE